MTGYPIYLCCSLLATHLRSAISFSHFASIRSFERESGSRVNCKSIYGTVIDEIRLKQNHTQLRRRSEKLARVVKLTTGEGIL